MLSPINLAKALFPSQYHEWICRLWVPCKLPVRLVQEVFCLLPALSKLTNSTGRQQRTFPCDTRELVYRLCITLTTWEKFRFPFKIHTGTRPLYSLENREFTANFRIIAVGLLHWDWARWCITKKHGPCGMVGFIPQGRVFKIILFYCFTKTRIS